MVGADHKKAARAAFSGLVSFKEYMLQIVTVHVDTIYTMDPNATSGTGTSNWLTDVDCGICGDNWMVLSGITVTVAEKPLGNYGSSLDVRIKVIKTCNLV